MVKKGKPIAFDFGKKSALLKRANFGEKGKPIAFDFVKNKSFHKQLILVKKVSL